MTLSEILKRADELNAEIDALRPIDPEQEQRIMQKFRLDLTFHSNAIEGNQLTYGDTEAWLLQGKSAQGKPFRDYLDMKGHHTALDHLLDIVRHPMSLTEADVRELHKITLVEPYDVDAKTADGRRTKRRVIPGRYKSTPNHVETSTGEMHYYASPEETPAKMADLMAWYRRELDKGELHPLILAAMFHYKFVAIHPFDDGNGRMARLLMNLVFMQAGFPPVIIRLDIKGKYISALEKVDADNDPEPFNILIGEALKESLSLYLQGAKGEDIEDSGDVDKKIAILEKKLAAQKGIEYRKQETEEKHKSILLFDVLRPFLSELHTQFAKFNRFFDRFICVSSEQKGDITFSIDESEQVVQHLSRMMGKVVPLQVRYQWDEFRIDTQQFNIWLVLNIFSGEDEFAISYKLSSGIEDTIINSNYDKLFSEDELKKRVREVANEVYQIIDQTIAE